ncbi:MAG TPA: hypothetical protein PK916_13205 [Bacteroidota bacterium]|nr:hypothetical protein [Bacteroidota bacterium]
MRIIVHFFLIGILALLLTPSLRAQAQQGSIESSWNRAPRQEAPRKEAPKQVIIEEKRVQRTLPPAGSVWDNERSATSRPWPLPSNPGPRDYYTANTAVIDSLARLYCLSPGYVSSLRLRNEECMSTTPGNAPKDFSYQGQKPQAAARPSVQALHRELLQLLERCLSPR